jgi:transposase-like protein
MAAPATTATAATTTNGSPKRHAGRTRPRYAPEFKAEAIALVRRVTAGGGGGGGGGRGGGGAGPLTRVAHDLGVSVETLRAWVKQDDVDGGRRDGLTTEEREELRRLRRENRLLKMERDVLKKAAVFFAKEGDTIR